jgi:hypothetical protein
MLGKGFACDHDNMGLTLLWPRTEIGQGRTFANKGGVKSAWVLAAGLAFMQSVFATDVKINGFDPARLHLSGSYCTFERRPHEIVLVSDWAGKFWMQVALK